MDIHINPDILGKRVRSKVLIAKDHTTYTREEMSDATGISYASIRLYTKKNCETTLGVACAEYTHTIAKVLGYRIEELFLPEDIKILKEEILSRKQEIKRKK